MRVDGAVQVTPLALHTDVGFIHSPEKVWSVSGDGAPEAEFGCKSLNPAPDRGMIDLQAPFGQQFLDIPVGQAEARIPSDRTQDDLGLEMPPLARNAAT